MGESVSSGVPLCVTAYVNRAPASTLSVVAVVFTLVLVVAFVGWRLPVKHRVTRSASFSAAPDVVYASIASPQHYPEWRSKVKSVEMLPDHDGHTSFREIGGDGTIAYVM